MTAAPALSERQTLLARAGAYVALTKPRIIELLLVTTLPTMVVAAGGWPSPRVAIATLAAGTLAAAGANAANMYADRDIDALMRRTSRRPLVTGAATPGGALFFAAGLEIAAFCIFWLAVNVLSAVLALAAALFYVFVYTLLLKRTSRQNIVIGGAAGAVPVLVGWAAVRGSLEWTPVVLFALVFLWTPPHFWALAVRYRDDYATARLPMMPVASSLRGTAWQILLYTLATVATSVLFGVVARMGWVYWAPVLPAGAVFILLGHRLLGAVAPAAESASSSAKTTRAAVAAAAMQVFHWSISYLSLLFVAMGLDVLVR